jgi:hypothetical protein
VIRMYVITHNTSDYGLKFVVRHHVVVGGKHLAQTEPHAVMDTLQGARNVIPKEYQFAVPMLEGMEDPVLVEAWSTTELTKHMICQPVKA